jgi:hypothetical protein
VRKEETLTSSQRQQGWPLLAPRAGDFLSVAFMLCAGSTESLLLGEETLPDFFHFLLASAPALCYKEGWF